MNRFALLHISATTTTQTRSRLTRASRWRRDMGPRKTTTPAATSPEHSTCASRTFSCLEKGGARPLASRPGTAAELAAGGACSAGAGDDAGGTRTVVPNGLPYAAGAAVGPPAASAWVRPPSRAGRPAFGCHAAGAMADPEPVGRSGPSTPLLGLAGGLSASVSVKHKTPFTRHRSSSALFLP